MYDRRRRIYYKSQLHIHPLELFESYDWICAICQEKIDPLERFPSCEAATIEHLIPLSRGGSHSMDNIRPAHARCNSMKGNRTLEELNGNLCSHSI
jgi:5-methylcytosine-specific restriction endonuclease McrA